MRQRLLLRRSVVCTSGALLVIASMSACAAAEPSGSSRAEPTDHSASPSTASAGPTGIADVSCSSLLPGDALGRALGGPVVAEAVLAPFDDSRFAVGGAACSWNSTDQSGSRSVTLGVIPYAAADDGRSAAKAPGCEVIEASTRCSVVAVKHGWLYDLSVHVGGATESERQSRLVAVDDVVAQALAEHPAPGEVPQRSAVDCDALVPIMSSEEVTGTPATLTPPHALSPTLSAAEDRAAVAQCAWPDPSGMYLAAFPHSPLAISACERAVGAEKIELPGVARAVVVGETDRGGILCATDDTSSVVISAPVLAGDTSPSRWADAAHRAYAEEVVPAALELLSR